MMVIPCWMSLLYITSLPGSGGGSRNNAHCNYLKEERQRCYKLEDKHQT